MTRINTLPNRLGILCLRAFDFGRTRRLESGYTGSLDPRSSPFALHPCRRLGLEDRIADASTLVAAVGDSMEQQEMHRADPHARRSAVLLIFVGAGTGLALIWLLQVRLAALQAASMAGDWDAATAGYRNLFLAAFALMTAAGLGTGAWIWRQSAQVLREQRHPPASARLIRDMPVLRGNAAVRVGRIGRALAIAFLVVTLAGAGIGAWLLASLG